MNHQGAMVATGVLVALGLAGASRAAETPGGPSLAGRWQFNAKQSEDPHEKVKAGRPPGGFGGPGRGGHPRGGPGGEMPGGFGRGGPPGDRRETMRRFFNAPERLDIAQTDSEVAIVQEDGTSRRLRTDGQKQKHEGDEGETKTKWEGEQLIIETQGAGGFKMSENYALSADRRQLLVTVRLENPAVSVRRVYDVVE
jgi:hypothetical protein